ncbi:cation:proton antiporter [Streptomyces sp. NPDC047860]|uniref:cation:proton antiporter domain-containing protein n=1 Tax=Streptomyces sp. NPDC047860 TaxID=3155743 RepID=UPI0033DF8197
MRPDAAVTHFLFASALILTASHAAGWLARRLKQPYIVGQLPAGIALGPSLLGSDVASGPRARTARWRWR